ncbi:MAG TPA: NADH-ubiquinone oxidoreductase-F iron-sulfur binding region domain-containing protein [Gaiellaceae bacterium]|nr:NADH-ubiquinone oxidoreductase-F iron-sulfur binding region domain-containing protein [Gaiellaceae bacterium]
MSGAAYRRETTRAPAPAGLPRLLACVRADGRAVSLDAHLRRYGGPPAIRGRGAGTKLIEAVAASGLRGRGGAGFPTARKLEAVAARGGRSVVVANGTEGEPPSGKDKVLLAYLPHLVLDGAVIAARAVGAREAIVAVGRATHDVVAYAIAERRHAQLDGGVSLRVVRVPERFVAGEETALVQFLGGGPALPAFTPPRPFERGVGGAPTLVQNVETLAHVAQIARFGPEWFRGVGAGDERGSALVTLSGAVQRPGVFEFALGTPLRDVVAQAGGASGELGAVLSGGYFGTWLPAREALAAPLSEAGLAPLGGALGARAIVALPAGSCGVLETARVVRWLASESAGQCGPCVHGLAAIASDLVQIARCDDRAGSRRALERRLPKLEGRGACKHPDGVVRLVESALRVFADEVELHVRHGRCSGRAEHAVLPLPARRPEAVR